LSCHRMSITISPSRCSLICSDKYPSPTRRSPDLRSMLCPTRFLTRKKPRKASGRAFYSISTIPTIPMTANPSAASALEASRKKRSEEHTSELQSPDHLVCRLLLEKKNSHTEYLTL